MNLTSKIAFFETKDWELPYINKAFSPENMFLYSDTIQDAKLKSTEEVIVLSTFIKSTCTRDILQKFPNLKFITTRSTGFDHIDISYCKEKGIIVSNVPNYGQNTVAEHAMALLLTLAKRIPESIERVKSGSFSPDGLTGFDIKDKVIGVVGTGHIGKNFISMAKGFGANIIAFDVNKDLSLENELGFTYVELDYLFAKSDIISLHVPYLKTTHHMIDDNAISKMKDGIVIINTSRGGLIDTKSLLRGLKSKKIGAVGLDVVEEENLVEDGTNEIANENHVIMDMTNCVVTPHNAFNTHEALVRIVKTAIQNIQAFESKNPVNIVS
jgi:D-lactate dehydrogenase